MTVRAFYTAAKVKSCSPPYDTLHLKIVYPAQEISSSLDSTGGMSPADCRTSPFQVVILFNGINCGPEGYQWLAIRLAEHGLVVVTFSWVGQSGPGFTGLTPGLDISNLTPDHYGTAPTATAMPAVLEALEQLNAGGVLAGLLDLDHVILGGHSAGGRAALENANTQFFPGVAAAFAYGAHTAAGPQLGYPPGQILALPDEGPLLLIGGTCDGVIANSGHVYGVSWEHPTTPVIRTFQESISGGRGDCYLLILEGANHYSVVHPFDPTTARSGLDFTATGPESELRNLMASAICLFLDRHVNRSGDSEGVSLATLTDRNPLVAVFERK